MKKWIVSDSSLYWGVVLNGVTVADERIAINRWVSFKTYGCGSDAYISFSSMLH